MKKITKILSLVAVVLLMAACASKKTAVDTPVVTPTTTPTTKESDAEKARQAALNDSRNYVKRVADNAVYVDNLSSKIDFTLNTGSKDINVNGKIQMRRNDVIRIQLFVPLIGMEAGRLEFTKDYVMIVDRIHAEYIKGDYNQVDFLKNNGINFYSLQALFWNQLFMPGKENVSDSDLSSYGVKMKSGVATLPVTLKKDNMSYQWLTEAASALIKSTEVTYSSKSSGNTKLTCTYDDFKPLGVKQFPAHITLNMNTNATKKARTVKLDIKMKSFDTSSKWETRTTLSKKYKQVSVDEVMKKLTSL